MTTIGPIGERVGTWRRQRSLAAVELASAFGGDVRFLDAVEAGAEWVDRRSALFGWAEALRLDPMELTGQPYPPVSADHAVVQALAYRLRRLLAGFESAEMADAPTEVEGLVARAGKITMAERRGDELLLARELPRAVGELDEIPHGLSDAAAQRLERVRVEVHVTAANLMRRLGYPDLAWLLLHRAAPGQSRSGDILTAEVRLLLDLGWPE